MDGAGIRQEFTQFAVNAGLTKFIIVVGGYKIMRDDIIAYRNAQEPQEWDAQVPPPQHFEMGPDGYYEW